jgi:hypothetical protein
LIRTSIDLMTIFASLKDHELLTTSVEMWSEVFTAWAAMHGRVDAESAQQLGEYEEFLRASIWHLKQLRDAHGTESANEGQKRHAETVLTGIFAHVAQSIAFAERKIAGGKMPGGAESAVLGREELVRLLDDDVALLDQARRRHREP